MLDDVIATVLGVVRDLDPVLRIAVAGVAIMLETSVLLGLFVPGDTIVFVASSGIQGPVEWISTIVVVIVGALCGESVGFAIGRWFGPRIRESWLGRRLGHDRLDRASAFLARRGGVAVFLSRFLPVLHSVVPLVAGMGGMRYRTFIAWTLPACILWSGAYVSAAAAAAATYDELASRLHGAGYVFVGIVAVFLLGMWAVKTILTRRVAREEARQSADASPGDAGRPDAEPSA